MCCPPQVSPCQRLHSSLPPLPLYDQPPCSPYTSPETSSAPSLPRSPSVNGEHKLPIPQKATVHSKTLVAPDTVVRKPLVLLSIFMSVKIFIRECFVFGLDHNSSLSPESPGFSQPLRLTPDGSGPGKLRPVCEPICFWLFLCVFYEHPALMSQYYILKPLCVRLSSFLHLEKYSLKN